MKSSKEFKEFISDFDCGRFAERDKLEELIKTEYRNTRRSPEVKTMASKLLCTIHEINRKENRVP